MAMVKIRRLTIYTPEERELLIDFLYDKLEPDETDRLALSESNDETRDILRVIALSEGNDDDDILRVVKRGIKAEEEAKEAEQAEQAEEEAKKEEAEAEAKKEAEEAKKGRSCAVM